MSVAQFAIEVGVSVAPVYEWQRRVRQQTQVTPAQAMVRVIPTAPSVSAAAPCNGSGVSVVLSNGLVCQVEAGFDDETLIRLVKLLTADVPREISQC